MKSELFSILRKLSPQENRKFKCFLKNPYFSHNRNLYLLFEQLVEFYPLYEISEPDKIKIFKSVYRNVEYNSSTFRGLLHLLLTCLEDFVNVEQTIKNKNSQPINFLKFLYDRNIDEVFEKNVGKFESIFKEQMSYFSSDDIFKLYEIEILKYNYYKLNEKILHVDSVLKKSEDFSHSSNYLLLHFFIEMVSDFVIRKISKRKFENNKHTDLEIENLINIEQLGSIIGIGDTKDAYHLYLLLYKTFKNFNDVSYYFEYKKTIEKNFAGMRKEDAAFHYTSLVSYCLLKKNSTNYNLFAKELWGLYEIILKNGYYVNSKNYYLDTWLYRAILFLGLKLHFFNQVKQFIDIYSLKVKPSEINNIKKLSYAYYYYEMGDLNLAMEHAKKIRLTNFVLKYDIKNLLIKIYYELNYFDSLESIIHTYHEFLRNDMILNKEIKSQFHNFLIYVERLVRYSIDGNRFELEYHRNHLLNKNCVYAKEWLLEKYQQSLQLKECVL